MDSWRLQRTVATVRRKSSYGFLETSTHGRYSKEGKPRMDPWRSQRRTHGSGIPPPPLSLSIISRNLEDPRVDMTGSSSGDGGDASPGVDPATNITDHSALVLSDTPPRGGIDNPAFHDPSEDAGHNDAPPPPEDAVPAVDTSMLTEVKLDADAKERDVAEAVNLELVNLKPYATDEKHHDANNGVNGIPVKKEGEDAGDGYNDPYDEYFVPVNEHRKYIR
uniref:Uncharacterized protein n=1 Tax=Timema cristinae TaxID=61476 RepID=A0A7R9D3S2_TIMCR|nr:unnamed protein product [Timema cristinae]